MLGSTSKLNPDGTPMKDDNGRHIEKTLFETQEILDEYEVAIAQGAQPRPVLYGPQFQSFDMTQNDAASEIAPSEEDNMSVPTFAEEQIQEAVYDRETGYPTAGTIWSGEAHEWRREYIGAENTAEIQITLILSGKWIHGPPWRPEFEAVRDQAARLREHVWSNLTARRIEEIKEALCADDEFVKKSKTVIDDMSRYCLSKGFRPQTKTVTGDNGQPILTRLGSPREARSQSPEVKRPQTAEEELQSGLSRQPPETPEIQEAAERVWDKMKHYDYMGSVFSTMRDMIHEDPWSDRERMLKDLKYVPGHDPEVAKEMSNCLLYTSPSPRDATLSRMPSSA